ncbi:uncharacterized protein N7487_009574 [Penicillium crustosum]|uniref:uncharacterized protein n=1 Tax=Penicillium crustosum TaxID=36656 RepID=UPI0023A6DF53|nr:uncharacterized protein N7487_009574 [Penicillium crustosum]KAJ5395271.1 hypothetical protein N7487_009574 [Penicillium crustosum]
MGFVYHKLDQSTESLQFFRKALIGEENVLGPAHVNTLSSALWTGLAYITLNQQANPLELFTKALTGLEKAMAPDNEEIRNSQTFV